MNKGVVQIDEEKKDSSKFELDLYIDDLCEDNKNGKDVVDSLLLRTRMKKYMKQFPNSVDEKINILKVLSKYKDIFQEFCEFLLTGDLQNGNFVCEKGYTVYDILNKEPCLYIHTAFLWLVYLRDDTKKSKKVLDLLEVGLPVDSTIKISYNVEKIKDYLNEKENLTDAVIKKISRAYYRHPDIANEFGYWIRNKCFLQENPIVERGYTAQKLYEENSEFLDVQGVFSLLITLRENPTKALQCIQEGFVRK